MHIQVVNFNLEGIGHEEYMEVADTVASAFAEVPGLISKAWLSDPEGNTYGGVYTWESREAMEAFGQTEFFQGVAGNPNFKNFSARSFDVLEGPSKVTGIG
ncbi:MAG: YdhR family protein [Planctomycetota bacterium]|nr:YdhR family protein [Planctomycetota bacterium]